jgi:hypothetical protein
MTTTAWPNIRELAQPFFDRHYADGDCWRLVVDLMEAGGFGRLDGDPVKAVRQVQEVWFQDDPRDPLTLVQPWDWYLLRQPHEGPAVRHIGVVLDAREFIHVRRGQGVRIEPLRRWVQWLLQIARLRVLC